MTGMPRFFSSRAKRKLTSGKSMRTAAAGRIWFHLSRVKQEDPSKKKHRGKSNFLETDSEANRILSKSGFRIIYINKRNRIQVNRKLR